MTLVFQAFRQAVDDYPNADFLHIPASACPHYSDVALNYSYAEFEPHVQESIQYYREVGLVAGQRVALLLENRPEFFQHFFALNALGVSVVPINPEMQPDEQAYLLNHSEACLLVHLPAYSERANTILGMLERPVQVVATDTMQMPDAPVSTAKSSIAYPAEEIGLDTECALLYTSGSTGQPKGCILSNDYFIRFGHWYRTIGGYCRLEPGAERLLTPLPLVHMNAMAVSTMGMLMTGGCIIQLDRFHPKTWWQSVLESRATIVHYLGVLPAILLELPITPQEREHAVKFGFGAGVNPRHHGPFEKRFGFPLIESWAMTESGSGGCVTANKEPRHVGQCCFGKPDERVEIRLVDEESAEVATGEPGELLVRARGDNSRKGFFSGYLKDPGATEAGWLDGWWHTGDVVREGADGSLFFVDRRKNVIRRSGENIAALEVEAALAGDPHIQQCVVCAVPDELRGDEVMAIVVAAADATLDLNAAESVIEHARRTLAYYKLPGYIALVDTLPLTASQKPRRAEIKQLGKTLLESGACFDLRHLKSRKPGSKFTGAA